MRPLIVIFAAVFLAACASTRPAPSSAIPDDFWLSLTVMAPTDDPAAPRAQRPARYLVEADRALRVVVGAGASESSQPPILRQLSESQARDLFTAFRASSSTEPGNDASVAPTREDLNDRHLIVVSYRLDTRRRTIVVDPALDPDRAARLFSLADHLAQLAWLPASR